MAPTTEVKVGETVQLTATAWDADGTVLEDKSFEWTTGSIVITVRVAPRPDPITVGLQE